MKKILTVMVAMVAFFAFCAPSFAAPILQRSYSHVEKRDVKVDVDAYVSLDNYSYTNTVRGTGTVYGNNGSDRAYIYNYSGTKDNKSIININRTNVIDNSITNEYIRKKK